MTVGKLGVNKLGYQSVGNVLVITTVTTTTTSEPAGESSNTAEDVNEHERHRTERVHLTGWLPNSASRCWNHQQKGSESALGNGMHWSGSTVTFAFAQARGLDLGQEVED